jgi:hypothetical protein
MDRAARQRSHNTGDTNTGIFFPAADTVGVAVGGTEVWRYGSNPTTAKNLIINGAVTVAQRGDTRTGLGASGLYLADQWKYEKSGSPTGLFTFSRGTGITGANKSLRFEVTTADVALAADALYQFTQKVEAQNLQHLLYGTASAKSVTYQAKIKSDWAGTMTLYVIAPDGSRSYAAPLVVAGDESQETFTFTLPGDASGAINNDTGVGFDWMITLAGGSNFQGGTTGAWAASNNNMHAEQPAEPSSTTSATTLTLPAFNSKSAPLPRTLSMRLWDDAREVFAVLLPK